MFSGSNFKGFYSGQLKIKYKCTFKHTQSLTPIICMLKYAVKITSRIFEVILFLSILLQERSWSYFPNNFKEK